METNFYFRVIFSRLSMVLIMIMLLHHASFGQLAEGEGECNFVGNIISNSIPSDFSNYWNQVTPENSGKWGLVESTRDNMNWTQLDMAYNHALTNGYPFKHHAFIWNQQKPSWIDGLSTEEKLEEIEEWIRLYGERYPETDFIDVVNEPLHAAPTFKDAMGGNGESGYDWVIWSFEKAREHNPNAKLLLNDYNILNSMSATNSYLYIIELLQERNLIDGIGLQGHFLETTANNTIKANLDKLAATGLPIYISEYDVNLANDADQEAKIKEQFPLLYQHEGVKGITLWGYRQNQIWRTDAYLVRSNGTERPALTWLRDYLHYRCSGVIASIDVLKEKLIRQVYPNPTKDGPFTISLNSSANRIIVSDISGRLIHIQEVPYGIENVTLNLSLKSGIYFIHVFGEGKTNTEKLIVKN